MATFLRPVLVKPITGSTTLAVFDLATQQLTHIPLSLSRPFPKDYGITFITDHHTFLLAGGAASGTYIMLPYCLIVNVVAREVKEIASLPISLKGMRLVTVAREVYCIGGCTEGPEHIEPQSSCFIYAEKHDTWVRLADMPQAVVFPGVFVEGGEVWVTGGFVRTDAGAHVMDLIQVYSVSRNEWRVLAETLLRPSYLHACMKIPSSSTLVCCGLRDTNSNRFSYNLGRDKRSLLPEKISMSIVDPVVLFGDCVFLFNDEMNLLIYDWREERWTCIASPETLS